MSHKPIRVVVVDDSRSIRELFSRFLSDAPGIEVVGSAEHPHEARQLIKQTNPDVVTLDIEMPQMDGLSFLEKIMTLRPMPVVMVSTLTRRGAEATIRSLELGAIDYIAKPADLNALELIREELVQKVTLAASARVKPLQKERTPGKALTYCGNANKWLIAIGASTGGVEALREVLAPLPPTMPPIVVTQHMPSSFTASFATRLNTVTSLTVQEAVSGSALLPGHVYIANGARHLKLQVRAGQIIGKLNDDEAVCGHKPSVDVLFDSAAKCLGAPNAPQMIGVILTGMGRDGAAGLKHMHDAGAHTIGQSETSCVVYGMPKAAKALGGITQELSLTEIAPAIVSIANN